MMLVLLTEIKQIGDATIYGESGKFDFSCVEMIGEYLYGNV